MQVVLVEDDAQLRAVMVVVLRRMGMHVLAETADGQAALDLLACKHPDLILTDCQMPNMDGIALVRNLRARGDRTPIIMISGQEDPHIMELAMQAGVDLFLPKPLNAAMLTLAIDQTIPGWAA